MARNLAEEVRNRILSLVRTGEFSVGEQLPPEDELARQVGASRLTTREAVKILAAQRVLNPVQGRGTYLNPISDWLSIDAVVEVRGSDDLTVMAQLLEIRSIIEVSAAALLAPRLSETQREDLTCHLNEMEQAHAENAVERAAQADLAFHDVILTGCGNPFVIAAIQPFRMAITQARLRTSGQATIRQHAIVEHRNILEALSSGDSELARAAMQSHMDQTRDDTEKFLLK